MKNRSKLHRKLTAMSASLKLPSGPRRGGVDIPGIETLIRNGLDPVHAAYASVQHITSFFAESVSGLAELKSYARIVARAEDEYMPAGPPMSPLTASFFTTWAFYDLRFNGTDTLATHLVEASDIVGLNRGQLDVLHKLTASRLGVYEHAGMDGHRIRLRELVTGVEYSCHNPSGYRGHAGELWYVRLLPPLDGEADRHIAFTTPYILIESDKNDWAQYLRRGTSQCGSECDGHGLHRLLKYGPSLNHWNEFVFKAYHHHQSDAIFLAGIPDIETTLPHA